MALRRLELDESHDIAKYAKQLKELGDEPSNAILKQVLEDEQEHYRILDNLIRDRRPLPQPSSEEAKAALNDLVTSREEGHRQAAGWVGDAIYGINDGLGSIFGIVSGVSGATLGNSKFVLIAGLAGMIASAHAKENQSRSPQAMDPFPHRLGHHKERENSHTRARGAPSAFSAALVISGPNTHSSAFHVFCIP